MSDNAPARPFLELIEATLNRRGKTKAWLAQRSKVNRNTINNWGTQPRTPQAANVIAVAEALDIEQDRALRLAGLRTDMPRDDRGVSQVPLNYEDLSNDELAAELGKISAEVRKRLAD